MYKYNSLTNIFSFMIVCVGFCFSSVSSGNSYENQLSVDSKKDFNCIVYYDDFLVERVFSLSENQIEHYALKFQCDAKKVEALFNSATTQKPHRYEPSDVKAKIIIDNSIYFIDCSGYVRNEKKISKINVNDFLKTMSHTLFLSKPKIK